MNPNQLFLKHNQRGVSALYAVIIISAIAFLFASSVTFSIMSELEARAADDGRVKAGILAAGCVDEALRRIDINIDLELSDYNLPIGEEYCIINIVKSGMERNIIVEGVSTVYHQRIIINADVSAAGIVVKNYNFGDLD